MLLFPLLGGFFSLLFLAALLYPTLISGILEGKGASVLSYVFVFVAYLVLSFIATFFNVCVVYTTKVRFEGGNATFMESIRFAMSRAGKILSWSLVSATVGLLMHALDQLAQRVGGIGQIVINLLRGLLGLAWSVVTVFVVPAMVYENTGPVDSIKSSVAALKKTWGESLIRHYGLGLVQTIAMFVGLILCTVLIVALSALGPGGLVAGIAFTVLYVLSIVLLFSVLNGVFNTALYVYAKSGMNAGTFDEEMLASAFRQKG